MTISRMIRPLVLGAIVTALPVAASAQVVSGQTLTGDWVRTDSNNDPNDLMRIVIGSTGGVLTSVPAAASRNWKIGDVLWRGIQANGSVQVRGSDGNYYPATMKLNGPDEIRLTVHYRSSTAGDDQTWHRAGPDISGDWVLVGPPGVPGDGTRIRVQAADASVRYLTAAAPRVLRVGSRIWQSIGASGGLQVLGSDGQHHAGTWSLVAPDRIQVNAPGIAGGAGQIWVRPSAVQAARTALAAGAVRPPPQNPNQPGSGLQPPGGLPGVPTTPTTPPVAPAPPRACLATSMPHDATGLTWGWGMSSPSNDDPLEETLGIREHMNASLTASGFGGDVPSEIENVRLPGGLQDGYLWIWDRRSRRIGWEQGRSYTPTVLAQKIAAAKTGGKRPTDIERRDTPGGEFYSVIWETNREGIDWRVHYDLTGQEYADSVQTLRGDGYRLVDVEGYQTASGQQRYAAVWWASCDNSNWKQEHFMDRTSYLNRVTNEARQGFQVIDIESFRTTAGQRYAVIWQQVPSDRDWAVRTDRDLRGFLNYQQEYSDLGMRLVDFESYQTANGVRYAGVWAENDRRYDYPFRTALEDSVENYRQRHTIPGVSVVVMRGDEVIYQGGFGWADSAARKRASSRTIYRTASVAKVIGATVAARLEASRSDLDLSDPTSDYLTGLPSHHTHTVEQLLSKTGCMFHYPEGPEPVYQYYRWRNQPTAGRTSPIAQMQASPLLAGCTPGQHYRYSTHGFTFVGAVLESVVGDDIETILTDELFLPFGLASMKLAGAGVVAAPGGGMVQSYHTAQAYHWDSTTVAPNQRLGLRTTTYENSAWKVMGGGLQSDALDMARFGRLTFQNQIADTTRLWTSQTTGDTRLSNGNPAPNVGLAWVLGMRNARPDGTLRNTAEHGGVAPGARSWLGIYRDDDAVVDELVVAVLTNQRFSSSLLDDHPIASLGAVIAGTVFADPPPP